MPDVVPTIVASLVRQTIERLDLASAIAHPGESGRARENTLRDFIIRLLPTAYEASTGFVFNSAGEISPQVDLVIYRRGYAPVFEIGGVNHFMVEAVAAVIEVKAAIESREVLGQALENIRRVKALDRTAGGRNYVLHGNHNGGPVVPDQFAHQIFGAIVTEQSLAAATLVAEWTAFLAVHPRPQWPNAYYDVRHLALMYAHHSETGSVIVAADPSDAGEILVSNASVAPPLQQLAEDLLDLLRVAEVIDYSPAGYFRTAAAGEAFPLPAEGATPLRSGPPTDETPGSS
jgi:hypothetical protein